MMDETMGFTMLVPLLTIVAITVIPTWALLRRTGKSLAWLLLLILPLGAIIVMWILAFSRWPKQEPKDANI